MNDNSLSFGLAQEEPENNIIYSNNHENYYNKLQVIIFF